MFGLKTENFSALTDREELIFEKNIVWLFGSARGGTSWVALELLSHNTNNINEPHIEDHLSMRAYQNNRPPFFRRIDNPLKSDDYFFSEKYKEVWMQFLKKLILNRFFAQTKNIDKKTVVKEPCSFGATDILTECMNNSKTIILQRDGRDVLDSIYDAKSKDGFMTKATGKAPIPNKINFITNISYLWVNRTEHFLKTFENLPKDLRWMVKYEDILKNTFDELDKLYDFLEIDISKDEIQNIISKFDFNNIPERNKGSGKFHRSASPGKWKENFNEEEKSIMNEIMGETLKKIGY